jgi:hypothetical protein
LGRAGAARPSPPARPVAPPGPPTQASGSAATTHRGRGPNRRRQPRRVRPPHAAACSRAHSAAAATGAPHAGLACPVAQRHAWPPPHPTGPGSATDPLPTDARARQRRSPQASSAVDRAARHRGRPQGLRPVPVVTVAPPPRPGPQPPPPEVGSDERVRAGRTPAGWTPDGWTPDGWTPDG